MSSRPVVIPAGSLAIVGANLLPEGGQARLRDVGLLSDRCCTPFSVSGSGDARTPGTGCLGERNKTKRTPLADYFPLKSAVLAVWERKNAPKWYGPNCRNTHEKGHLRLSSQVANLVEAAGIEPASRDLSTKASTCVATDLNSSCGRLGGRLPQRLWENFFNRGCTPRVPRRSGIGNRLLGLSGENPQSALLN